MERNWEKERALLKYAGIGEDCPNLKCDRLGVCRHRIDALVAFLDARQTKEFEWATYYRGSFQGEEVELYRHYFPYSSSGPQDASCIEFIDRIL